MRGWDVANVSDIEALPGPGSLQWTPVRRHFDIRAFGINAYTSAKAGDDVVERHTEMTGHEEVYVVLTGSATFTLAGETVDAPAGTLVFVRDSEVERAAVAREDGTTVLALGAKPGTPYEPSAWEHWYAATPLGEQGDLEGAIAELRRGLELHPGHRMLCFQLARWQALAGDRDGALENLERAVAQSEHMRRWAQTEPAFDSIRADPRFPAPA